MKAARSGVILPQCSIRSMISMRDSLIAALGRNSESVPKAGSDGCRVGATHQRKALVILMIGGFHPPYEIDLRPFRNRLSIGMADSKFPIHPHLESEICHLGQPKRNDGFPIHPHLESEISDLEFPKCPHGAEILGRSTQTRRRRKQAVGKEKPGPRVSRPARTQRASSGPRL